MLVVVLVVVDCDVVVAAARVALQTICKTSVRRSFNLGDVTDGFGETMIGAPALAAPYS